MNEFQNDGELIDSSSISVVIQGLTHYSKDDKNCLYYQCINSIKTHLPLAEIIISTWKSQTCDETIVDRVIYNDEPESITSDIDINYQWNFNKMVVSTKNGIMACNREYVLKFRVDLSLLGTSFFRVREKDNVPDHLSQLKIFTPPINISNIFIKSPLAYHHYFLFHLSDIVQFGRKENLLDLWSRELLDGSILKHQVKQKLFFNHYSYLGISMCPEQALMIGWLNSHGNTINLPHAAYISRKGLYLSELSLSLNFNTINWDKTDILYPHRFLSDSTILNKYIYKSENLNYLYKQYNSSLLNKRFLYSLKVIYLNKICSKFFWNTLSREILLFLFSPRLYVILRDKWRTISKKSSR